MHRESRIRDRSLVKRTAVIFGLLLLIVAATTPAPAGQAPRSANEAVLTLSDLLKMPGQVLGAGTNTRPAGPLNLLTYRLDEVRLPRTTKVDIHGQTADVDTVWRLTITGGPFPVRDLPAVIWLDDQILGYGVENERLSEITAITIDRALLRQGATISLSYGEDTTDRSRLPEKLNFSGAR